MAANSIPRPEHPRPDFRRDAWLNLNGAWEFRYDPDDLGEVQQWHRQDCTGYDQRIVVPFPWQSELSGQHNPDYRGVAWYRRSFTVPKAWREQRVFLCFGAVDYQATVWVNDHLMGKHEGGYTPFAFDITETLKQGDNSVVVRVADPADLREIPHGKQRSIPSDPWENCQFTPSSGIWQTVWLELRPPSHITTVCITPDVDSSCARFELSVHGAAVAQGDAAILVSIQTPSGETLRAHASIALEAGQTTMAVVTVSIPDPQLWDVDTPNLYHVTLSLQLSGQPEDIVNAYFGMRKVAVHEGKVWLNHHPVYLMSALDQGFWPQGIHTAPSDDALRSDIAYAKRLGLNGLRKHIKIEDPRFAYWADVLGLLLWCDAPSPTSFTDLACRRLERDLQAMIERDYNHPSIIIWCPYNESWGFEFRLAANPIMQEWMAALYDHVKTLDPTRLVVDNSGWSHVKSDIADFHYYTDYEAEWRSVANVFAHEPDEATVLGHPLFAQGYSWQREPLMMSEYGAGWKDDRSWHLRWQTNELRRHPEIVGYTYTELYDIEHERAGYALYDRTPKDFGYDPATLNSDDFVVLDHRGPVTLWPGEPLRVDTYASLYGRPIQEGTLYWQVTSVVPSGEETAVLVDGRQTVQVQPHAVTRLPEISTFVPEIQGPIQLSAWLTDVAGSELARNYLDFEVFRGRLPRVERSPGLEHTTFTLRFSPGDCVSSDWNIGRSAQASFRTLEHEIFWGQSCGFVEYAVPLPPEVTGAFAHLWIQMEIGSRPQEITQSVGGRSQPSDLTISLSGIEVGTKTLSDLYVNAKGVLSRLNRIGPGEHGDWIEVAVPKEQLAAVEANVREHGAFVVRLMVNEDAINCGGLTLFGARSGRYGLDPTLVVNATSS